MKLNVLRWLTLSVCAALFLVIVHSLYNLARANASAVWQGDPIIVKVKPGQERRIDFPEPIVDLDVPQAIEARSRIVLTPKGQLHWLANEAYQPARVMATSISGTLYQLDIGTDPDASTETFTLVDPVLLAAATPAATRTTGDSEQRDAVANALIPGFLKGGASSGTSTRASYVDMARFALAHYIGPQRLIPTLNAAQVPVRAIDARRWLRLQHRALAVQPLAQWQINQHFVTAVGVENRSAQAVEFDPEALRGPLLFAVPLNPTLQAAGSGHNGTVWAVITPVPFNKAIP